MGTANCGRVLIFYHSAFTFLPEAVEKETDRWSRRRVAGTGGSGLFAGSGETEQGGFSPFTGVGTK